MPGSAWWGTIPSQSSTQTRQCGLPVEAGQAREDQTSSPATQTLTQSPPKHGRSTEAVFKFQYGVLGQKHAGGVVLGEPQSYRPHHLSCSILRGYKMAVKPVARQQLTQSHLGHLILEKTKTKTCFCWTPTPGRHLQAPPCTPFSGFHLGRPPPLPPGAAWSTQGQQKAYRGPWPSKQDRVHLHTHTSLRKVDHSTGMTSQRKTRIPLENQFMNSRAFPAR